MVGVPAGPDQGNRKGLIEASRGRGGGRRGGGLGGTPTPCAAPGRGLSTSEATVPGIALTQRRYLLAMQLADLGSIRLAIDTTVEFEGGRPGPQQWHVSVQTHDYEDNPKLALWMDGWTFRLYEGRDLAGELDALSADTEVFVPLVHGDDISQLVVDELDLAPLGDRLVLINHVRLAPELRGRGGIGRYLTGLAIRELKGGAALVALHASPFELRQEYDDGNVPEDIWEARAEALGPVWESLGFQRLDGHLYVLDPTMAAMDDAITAFHARIRPA